MRIQKVVGTGPTCSRWRTPINGKLNGPIAVGQTGLC